MQNILSHYRGKKKLSFNRSHNISTQQCAKVVYSAAPIVLLKKEEEEEEEEEDDQPCAVRSCMHSPTN